MKRVKKGFTLIEMVVVLAVIAILAAILFPTIAKHISESQVTRATNEGQVITAAIMMLYKDTGKWPSSNAAGVSGPTGRVDRVLTGVSTDPVPTGTAPGARTGAANWGSFGTSKQLADFLFFNNPDENTGATSQNEVNQDYPTSGEFAWKGPYIDKETYLDPWGNQYIISARYFPGDAVAAAHTVLVLSAGQDGLWSTSYTDGVTRLTSPNDRAYGAHEDSGTYIHDDIGVVITTNK
ncbi:MAG: prepilin-type N-terminal cleavage/methylation domain-containing protein [bacterium]|nr:prepilin-type N-terminal cleavage/methylation domain-containing protein [bacterium]